MKKYALILAGGFGTRLWPISTKQNPKQFTSLISDKPMIIETINRIQSTIPLDNIFIITNINQSEQIKSYLADILPQDNIIIEPETKGTAACIAFSTMYIQAKYGDGIICVFASDHYVEDIPEWNHTLCEAINYVSTNNVIMTIGIHPKYPETGYGYIKIGKTINNKIYNVDSFIEKPIFKKAKKYSKDSHYLWNSGNLIVKTSVLLELYKNFTPTIYNNILTISKSDWKYNITQELYHNCPNTSIDIAILEKAQNINVIKYNSNWSDIGTIHSLLKVFKKDNNLNSGKNTSIFINSKNTFSYSNSNLVISVGMRNTVIIECNGIVLVCKKNKLNKIPEIKKIIEQNNDLKSLL